MQDDLRCTLLMMKDIPVLRFNFSTAVYDVLDELHLSYQLKGLLREMPQYHDGMTKHGIKIVSEIDWDSFESYILEAPKYNIKKIPDFPDKEANATRLVKTYLCKYYDKSKISEGLEIPVYWKVREALNILNERNKSCDGPTKSNIF